MYRLETPLTYRLVTQGVSLKDSDPLVDMGVLSFDSRPGRHLLVIGLTVTVGQGLEVITQGPEVRPTNACGVPQEVFNGLQFVR